MADAMMIGDARLKPRFWAQVQPDESGCWLWTGRANKGGYARYNTRTQSLAHRVAYTKLIGPIPEGLTLDHLCRTKLCVNPMHLEPVTGAENSRRHNATTLGCEHVRPGGPDFRCEACQRKQRREKRGRDYVRGPSADAHGKATTYGTYKCRCDRCRAAWRDYMRTYNARRASARLSAN